MDKLIEIDYGEKIDCENGRFVNNIVIMLVCGIIIDWKIFIILFYYYFL